MAFAPAEEAQPQESPAAPDIQEAKALVLDCGGHRCRAGFSGDLTPEVCLPTQTDQDVAHGDSIFTVDPLGWDALEAAWRKTLIALLKTTSNNCSTAGTDADNLPSKVEEVLKDQRVLMSDPWALAPRSMREKIGELMFEGIGISAVHVVPQASLALFAGGRTSGMVLDSGHCVSRVVPVIEGTGLPQATFTLPLAGRQLTEYLRRGCPTSACAQGVADGNLISDWGSAERAKEVHCFVAQRAAMDVDSNSASLELPDGRTVSLGPERYRCPEALFQAPIFFTGSDGNAGHYSTCNLQGMVTESLAKMSCIDRQVMSKSGLLLSGGSTLFHGFPERLDADLQALPTSSRNKISVFAVEERDLLTWMGGSIVASLGGFQDLWVTKADYKEVGANLLLNRCC